LLLVSILGLFYYKKSVLTLINTKLFLIILLIYITSFLLAFVIDFFGTKKFLGEAYIQFLILIEVFPIAIFLSILAFKKLNFNLNDVIINLFIIGVFQSIISILMFIFPDFRIYFLSNILKFNLQTSKIFNIDYAYRGYGVGNSFLFAFPITQSFILIGSFILAIKKNYLYIFSIPILLIPIIFNARVGLVTIIVFFALLIISSFNNKKTWGLMFFISIFIIFSYYFIERFDLINYSKNLEWVFNIFTQFNSLLKGNVNKKTTIGNLFEMIHFPKQIIEIFIGSHIYIFNNPQIQISSDIGYIRKIYFGGVFYSLLIYSGYTTIFIKSFRIIKDEFHKIFLSTIFLMIFISHFKGDIFSSNSSFRLSVFIFMFIIVKKYISKE
jgi:hypothetical protein